MTFQEHLPQNKPARPDQEYGFSLDNFLADTWPYLLIIVVVLAIFFYARYSQRKRNKR